MAKAGKIRILLVDDHPIVLSGLRNSLSRHPHFEVVGEAADGMSAISKAKDVRPDIILMDISLPGINGLEAAKILRKEVRKAKVVILTMHNNKEYVLEIIRSGAWGYILKDTSPAELSRALERVYRGETFFSSSVSQYFIDSYVKQGTKRGTDDLEDLTEREARVLSLMGGGLSRREIAERLRVSVRTIDTYRWRLMKKLKLRSFTDLLRYALKEGYSETQ